MKKSSSWSSQFRMTENFENYEKKSSELLQGKILLKIKVLFLPSQFLNIHGKNWKKFLI